MRLPNRNNIATANDEDPLKRYYQPVLKHVYIKRLRMVLDCLKDENKTFDSIIEVGFGSGILFPELKELCHNLYGIDKYSDLDIVTNMLALEKIEASICISDIFSMPFKDGFFDALVSVSMVEHIEDLDSAFIEMKRVMKKGGILSIGFPSDRKLLDLYFKLMHLKWDFHPHPSGPDKIIGVLGDHFKIRRVDKFPVVSPIYYACKCEVC